MNDRNVVRNVCVCVFLLQTQLPTVLLLLLVVLVLLLFGLRSICWSKDSEQKKKINCFGATLSLITKLYAYCVPFYFGLPQLALVHTFISHFIRTHTHTHAHAYSLILWSFAFAFCVPIRVSFVYTIHTISAYISQCGGLNSICVFDLVCEWRSIGQQQQQKNIKSQHLHWKSKHKFI